MKKNSREALLFPHVPKCGGTTLRDILIHNSDGNVFSISETVATHYGKKWKNIPSDVRQDYAKQLFIDMPDKNGISLIEGHMNFGWHEYLDRPANYVTMLRDPVNRIISLYRYILGLSDHLHKRYIEKNALSISGFVESGVSLTTDNGMTRIISGIGNKVPIGACNAEHLEIAKYNIDNYFICVGIMEKYDETLLLLEKILNWKQRPYYVIKNKSKPTSVKCDVDDDSIKVISEINHLDINLFMYVQDRFNQQLTTEFSDLTKELSRFKNENLQSKYMSRRSRLMNVLKKFRI